VPPIRCCGMTPLVGGVPDQSAIAAGVLREKRGALTQPLMLALQPGDLRFDLRQLGCDKLLHLLPGEVIEAGDTLEQGNQLPEPAAKPLGLADKADPFQILGPVDAILAAPPGLGQQPHLFVEADRLGSGARLPGKFADIHGAARKGGMKGVHDRPVADDN